MRNARAEREAWSSRVLPRVEFGASNPSRRRSRNGASFGRAAGEASVALNRMTLGPSLGRASKIRFILAAALYPRVRALFEKLVKGVMADA
jgi:hypothetical protein